MSMDNQCLDIFPEQVYTSGQQVTACSTDASSLASHYLTQLGLAAGGVHHPTVSEAITRYHETWQPLVNEVSSHITQLGERTSGAAVIAVSSDQEAGHLLDQQVAAGEQQTSYLARDLNAPTPI
ncbi:MAG TPA: hypothetical protein VKZ67_02570 [Natronosporangium sp.]|nr:hypothetical protein [Natronosporangium sp.]